MSRPRFEPALLVLPLAFLAAEVLLRAHGLPYWLWFNLDPSYFYLIGGLNLLEGAPLANFQHPGVPVQLLTALTAALMPGDPLVRAETILARASDAMLAFDAALLWWMGRCIARRAGALLPALLAQTAPFITMLALKHGIEVEPEPLLLGAALMLMAGLVEEAAAPRAASLVGLAFAVAFGSACKITFAPLGLAPLILLAGWRRRGAYVALTALFFALWMLPELPNLAPMVAWFAGLAAHSGAYGQGPAQVVDWARYPHSFAKLFFARPLFLAAYAAGVAALALRRKGDANARVLFALLAAQLVQIALAAKHPSGHYILPSLELAGPVLGLAWIVLRDNGRLMPRGLARAAAAAALALILAFQGFAFWRQDEEMRREGAGARSVDLARDLPECAHIYVFMASSPGEAWFYNDSYAGGRYAARLKAIMPANDYFSVPWRSALENWDGPVKPGDITARYSCIAIRAAEPNAAESLARKFGAAFANAQKCRAGSEDILVAGAECPKPSP